jgi:hypothetical protein
MSRGQWSHRQLYTSAILTTNGVTVRGLVRIIIHLRRQVVVVCIP